MNDVKREAAWDLFRAFHWTPGMISQHLNVPKRDVMSVIHEGIAARRAYFHAARLARLPQYWKTTLHVPAGFSAPTEQTNAA